MYSIIRRHRTYDSIKRIIEKSFEEEKLSENSKKEIINSINELINDLNIIDELNKSLIKIDDLIETTLYSKYGYIFASLAKEDYINYFENDIDKFLSQFILNIKEYDFMKKYILLKQSILINDIENEKTKAIEEQDYMLDVHSITSLSEYYMEKFGVEYIDDCIENIPEPDKSMIIRFNQLSIDIKRLNKILDRKVSEKRIIMYEQMIPLIDKLTIDQLSVIKSNIPVVAEYKERFAKFVDYLYYYFYGDYPEWIKIELLKKPKLEDKFVSNVEVKKVKQHVEHIEEYSKIKSILPFA